MESENSKMFISNISNIYIIYIYIPNILYYEFMTNKDRICSYYVRCTSFQSEWLLLYLAQIGCIHPVRFS